MSINSVTISGNLTRDPELRQTQGGMAILSLGVAVNDRRRNQQTGEWEDYANFVDCTVFGNRAEALSRILVKGMKVCIDGRLHYSSWQDQNGQKRSKLEVTVNNLEFMSQRGNSPRPNRRLPTPRPRPLPLPTRWPARTSRSNPSLRRAPLRGRPLRHRRPSRDEAAGGPFSLRPLACFLALCYNICQRAGKGFPPSDRRGAT